METSRNEKGYPDTVFAGKLEIAEEQLREILQPFELFLSLFAKMKESRFLENLSEDKRNEVLDEFNKFAKVASEYTSKIQEMGFDLQRFTDFFADMDVFIKVDWDKNEIVSVEYTPD